LLKIGGIVQGLAPALGPTAGRRSGPIVLQAYRNFPAKVPSVLSITELTDINSAP
jgi:hypothetical protein